MQGSERAILDMISELGFLFGWTLLVLWCARSEKVQYLFRIVQWSGYVGRRMGLVKCCWTNWMRRPFQTLETYEQGPYQMPKENSTPTSMSRAVQQKESAFCSLLARP